MPSATIPDPARRAACVVCGAPVAAATAPFCGPGCRDRDLLQWLSDGHRIPGAPVEEDDADGLDSAAGQSL